MIKLNKSYVTVFYLFFFAFSLGYSQNSGPNHYAEYPTYSFVEPQQRNLDTMELQKERIVFHLSKRHLNKKDLLFFKCYLLSGTKQERTSSSGVLNLEFVDNEGTVLKKQLHKIDNGTVEGQLKLPKNLSSGKYFIRAHTRWMLNQGREHYVQQPIWVDGVPSIEDCVYGESEIHVFPESGTMLYGQVSRVIIKTPSCLASKTGQIGRIMDSNNNEVAEIVGYTHGFGAAIFKPERERTYYLELDNGRTQQLPNPENSGYLLTVSNIDSEMVKIKITASPELVGSTLDLVGDLDGVKYFESRLKFDGTNTIDIGFSKKDIPFGILELRLIDDLGIEQAKRPILVEGQRLNVDIVPIKTGTELSKYKIKVTDKNGNPVQTQIALSAKHGAKDELKEVDEDDLSNWLDLLAYPLNSDGTVMSIDRKKRFLEDLNVLIYAHQATKSSFDRATIKNEKKFPVQKGLELQGYAYNFNNELLPNTNIQIVAQSDVDIWIEEAETDSDGLLMLDDIQITGSSKLVFRTKGSDTSTKLVKFVPLAEGNQVEKDSHLPLNPVSSQKAQTQRTAAQPIETKGLVKLKEVEVEGKTKENKKLSPSLYGIDVPNTRIKFQDPDQPQEIVDLLMEMPGVTVSGLGNLNPVVSLVGAWGPVLWVIDGFPLSQNEGNVVNDVIALVSPIDVERIELLRGSDAAIFGTRASGGVISIHTLSGQKSRFLSRRKGQFLLQGFEPEVRFETYLQSLSKKAKEKSNLLYWNPKLETDANGEAIIRFSPLTAGSTVTIEASTVTKDGKIGTFRTNF